MTSFADALGKHKIPRLRRDDRHVRFAKITRYNTVIVDDLVKEIKALSKKGDVKEANKLIKIAEKILDNNNELQAMVGEVLSDAP